MDMNQGTPGDDAITPPPAPPAYAVSPDADAIRLAEAAALERRNAADALGGRVHQGLVRWIVLVIASSAIAAGLAHPDAAFLLAIAMLFALAQSWDVRDRARGGKLKYEPALEPGGVGVVLRALVPLAVPIAAALGYVGLGRLALSLPLTPGHLAAMRWCWGAAAACLAMVVPALARQVARAVLPRAPFSYTAHIAASIALALLLLPVPVRLLIDEIMDAFTTGGRVLVDEGSLVAQLAGEVALAVAAVGLWVARDARGVRERLGLERMTARHGLIALVGLAAVVGLNSGMEALEQMHFPALFAADQEMGKLIAGDLNVAAGILLGVSAGVGEELLVRGALQPRAGLFWASVLFTAGHVQYTWFGMLTILLLGVALGLVRAKANTTTAIVVHALYDMIAAIGTK